MKGGAIPLSSRVTVNTPRPMFLIVSFLVGLAPTLAGRKVTCAGTESLPAPRAFDYLVASPKRKAIIEITSTSRKTRLKKK